MTRILLIVLWLAAFIVALSLDSTIAAAVHDSGLAHFVQGKKWAQVLKLPGDVRFTIPVVLLVWVCRQIQWKQTIFLLLAQAVSGINALVKWMVGRYRPYKVPGLSGLHPFQLHPFFHGVRGLTQHDLSFPSGHECTAAVLAVAMIMVWPRGSWIFVFLAIEVGIERVVENAHYTSDVIAATGLAMLGTGLLRVSQRHTLLRNDTAGKIP